MKLRIAVLCYLSSLFLLTSCTRTTPPATVERDHTHSPYHTVKKGDSIASIAQKYNMDKQAVVRLNGIKPPYKIFVGQKLLVKTDSSEKTTREGDNFTTPATAEHSEMRGDVEVTTLQPMSDTPSGAMVDNEAAIENTSEIALDHTSSAEQAKIAAAGNYIWPVKGKIVKGYEEKADGNKGLNISAPQSTKVVAANNGVIAYTGNTVPGMGNVVLIKHSNGNMTIYAHLNDIVVEKGQPVKLGEKIGTVGKTGHVSEPQLHFEIRNGNNPIDPTRHLN